MDSIYIDRNHGRREGGEGLGWEGRGVEGKGRGGEGREREGMEGNVNLSAVSGTDKSKAIQSTNV